MIFNESIRYLKTKRLRPDFKEEIDCRKIKKSDKVYKLIFKNYDLIFLLKPLGITPSFRYFFVESSVSIKPNAAYFVLLVTIAFYSFSRKSESVTSVKYF